MDTTLIVMAVGTCSDSAAEFSVPAALHAGFTRAVFVIQPGREEAFRARVLSRFASKIPCELVLQMPGDVPAGCFPPEGRTKPLGTAHALWSCRSTVSEPFLLVQAGVPYDASTFVAVREFLLSHIDAGAPHPYCRVPGALAEGAQTPLDAWGFHPSVFDHIERVLRAFLQQPAQTLATAECSLPAVVGEIVSSGAAFVRTLPAQDR